MWQSLARMITISGVTSAERISNGMGGVRLRLHLTVSGTATTGHHPRLANTANGLNSRIASIAGDGGGSMTNQLGDAPTRRAAEDARAQRTMQELRWLHGALDEDTQEIVVPPSTLKINVGWRLRLAQLARRVLGK